MNLDSHYVALQAEEDLKVGEEMGENYALLGQPKKQLGALGLAAIVFFLVCGGSYGTEDLGGTIAPLYAILGIVAVPWIFSLPIALVTAELATSMTDQSGFIMWIKRGWGDFYAHLDTVLVNIIMILDLALYPGIFLTYLQALVNEFKLGALAGWKGYPINVVFVLIGGAINLIGLKAVGNSAKILTLLTLSPFVLFVILGFASKEFDGARLGSTKHAEPDYPLYFSVLLWSMCGYEYSGFLANEVQNPKKAYPLGMFGCVATMLFTYLLPVMVGIAVRNPNHKDEPLDYPGMADHLGFGRWLGYMLVGGALLSNMGTFVTYLSTSSQALAALAKEGKLPRWMASEFPKYKTPWPSILIFVITTCILVMFDFSVIVEVESVLYCIHTIIVLTSFTRLKFVEPDLFRPFKMPFGKVGGVLFVILPITVSCINIYISDWTYQVTAAILVILFGLIYVVVRAILRQRAKAS
jgi:amino acid transporter